jgi:DNA-binding FadR family transcriptional regulator
MIEITAARLAATRHTGADVERMKDAILRYRFADHANDPESLIDADLAFHTAIIQATRNQVLVQLFESISGLLREHRRQYGVAGDQASRQIVVPEHEAILAAITAGNREEAALRMQRHMRIIWNQIEETATHEDHSTLEGQSYLPMYEDED